METKEEYKVKEGDVVIVLPKMVIEQIARSAEKEHDPIALQTSINFIRKALADEWQSPDVRDLKDENFEYDKQPNIRWGDIAAFAGYKRVTTKPERTKLGAKRKRKAKLHTARVMKPVFQFGNWRVIMKPNEFIDVTHVPDKIFEAIKEHRKNADHVV
jgi:hypothetical protein